jgi:HAD superfamily hydrolase (TIGR01509 family)
MLKAVIFDLDGVIIDSEPIHVHLEKEIFLQYHIPVSEGEHYTYVGTSEKDMFTALKKKYQFNYSVDQLVTLKRERYTKYIQTTFSGSAIEGIPELIDDLESNGLALLLASSSPLEHINMVLSKFGLENTFKVKVSSCDVPRSKPAPDAFLEASRKAGFDPGECMVIEDSRNGTKAAKAAGMKCIGYLNPHSIDQDLSAADTVVKSFMELNYQALLDIY